MLSGSFQYKSPGSSGYSNNIEFRFCGDSIKYLLKIPTFRIIGIDLK